MRKIKFGWRIPAFALDDTRGAELVDQINCILEQIQGRFDSAWVADHFVPWPNFVPVEKDTLESWTTICYLAARFPTLRFGSIVLSQSYRNPALVAKMAATLQLLTAGRFILGLGAGWKRNEYLAYGYEFPSAAKRIQQLEEAASIIRAMWTATPASFYGKYYHVQEAHCEPRPDPRPPLLIGGGGERRTLKVVAQHADWWNFAGGTPAEYAHKLEVLRRHCDALGRDYDAIVKTWTGDVVAVAETEAEAHRIAAQSPFEDAVKFIGTPSQVAETLRQFTDVGVEHFILRFTDFSSSRGIELFADQVIPQFK